MTQSRRGVSAKRPSTLSKSYAMLRLIIPKSKPVQRSLDPSLTPRPLVSEGLCISWERVTDHCHFLSLCSLLFKRATPKARAANSHAAELSNCQIGRGSTRQHGYTSLTRHLSVDVVPSVRHLSVGVALRVLRISTVFSLLSPWPVLPELSAFCWPCWSSRPWLCLGNPIMPFPMAQS